MKTTFLLVYLILVSYLAYSQKTHFVTNSNGSGEGSLNYCIKNSSEGDSIEIASSLKELALDYPVTLIDKTISINFNNIAVTKTNWKGWNTPLFAIDLSENKQLKINRFRLDGLSNLTALFDISIDTHASLEFYKSTFINQKNKDMDLNYILKISNSGNLNFEYCDFENNEMPCFLIENNNEGIANFKNCSINKNQLQIGQIIGGKEITMEKCYVSENFADISNYPALIMSNIKMLSINSSRIESNTGFTSVLEMFTIDSMNVYDSYFGFNKSRHVDFLVPKGTFEDCLIYENGSSLGNKKTGIFNASNCSFYNCSFRDNVDGIGYLANTIIDNCTFWNNISDKNNEDENLTIAGTSNILNSSFSKNHNLSSGYSATGSGGAICIKQETPMGNFSAKVDIFNTKFSYNSANFGGAISGKSAINNCIFNKNTAINGGALFGVKEVSDCNFNENQAEESGGAIFSVECDIQNSFFVENSARFGSAIFAFKLLELKNSQFYENIATEFATIKLGDYRDLYDWSSINLKNSIFIGNNSGIYCYATKGDITQSIFIDNNGSDISSMQTIDGWKGKLTISNCNILEYGSVEYSDPVSIIGEDILSNSIVQNTNQSSRYKNCLFVYSYKSSDSKVYYRNIKNEINVFKSGIWKVFSDWSINSDEINMDIKLTSDAVNAGNNLYLPSSISYDFYGNPRISGKKVDIGAIEYTFPDILVEYQDSIRLNKLNPIRLGKITDHNVPIPLNIKLSNYSKNEIKVDSIDSSVLIDFGKNNIVLSANSDTFIKLEIAPENYGEFENDLKIYYSFLDSSAIYDFKINGNYITTTNATFTNDEDLHIYPNPVKNTLFIKGNNCPISKVSIFNLDGNIKKLCNSSNFAIATINISDLSGGIYLLRVNAGNKIYTRKIFISK